MFEFIKTTILKPVADVIFPPVCFICEQWLKTNRKIICERCFSEMPTIARSDVRALELEIHSPFFEHIYICYEFASTFKKLIHLLKYDRHLTLADYFAKAIINHFESELDSFDYIIPVPLFKTRQRERGYNQSTLIAASVDKYSNITLRDDLVIRVHSTRSQATLNRKQRINNVMDAFAFCGKSVDNKNVIIFDDVITTGSTLNACAKVLKENGARRIDLLALATPPF